MHPGIVVEAGEASLDDVFSLLSRRDAPVMIRRLTSIIRKEAIHIVRDRRTLALSFVMPIVMLLLLGYAANTDVRNIALVVVDQDRSPASRELIDAFRAADYFRVDYEADSEAQVEPLIGRGRREPP